MRVSPDGRLNPACVCCSSSSTKLTVEVGENRLRLRACLRGAVSPVHISRTHMNKKSGFSALRSQPVDNAVAYAMRVECQSDAFVIRAALADWVYEWKEKWCTSPDGCAEPPDMQVEFGLAWNPPSYEELQWLISVLEDCHVAAESLRPAAAYTGGRLYEELEQMMARPPQQTICQAREGLERTREWLPILKECVTSQKQVLAAELGRPKAHLARETKRLTKFWRDYSAQFGKSVTEEEARATGLMMAHGKWESRSHR